MATNRHVIKSVAFPSVEEIADAFFVSLDIAADMLNDNRTTGSTYEREIAIIPGMPHTVELTSNGMELYTIEGA